MRDNCQLCAHIDVIQFSDITDVVLKKHNKENNYIQNRLRHRASGNWCDVLITYFMEWGKEYDWIQGVRRIDEDKAKEHAAYCFSWNIDYSL